MKIVISVHPFVFFCKKDISFGDRNVLFRDASESEVTHRIGAWEIVSSHDLHVSLLNERHPKFIAITGVGAKQLATAIHREEIVNNHLTEKHTPELWQYSSEPVHLQTIEKKPGVYLRWGLEWLSTFLGTPLMCSFTMYFPQGLYSGSPLLFCG